MIELESGGLQGYAKIPPIPKSVYLSTDYRLIINEFSNILSIELLYGSKILTIGMNRRRICKVNIFDTLHRYNIAIDSIKY